MTARKMAPPALWLGLKMVRNGSSYNAAATRLGVNPERLARFCKGHGVVSQPQVRKKRVMKIDGPRVARRW
jgi:hypothetical protein